MVSKGDIVSIMRKFRVLSHYVGTRDSGSPKYAVFGPEGQVTAPTSHREAKADLESIVAQEILDLFNGDQP